MLAIFDSIVKIFGEKDSLKVHQRWYKELPHPGEMAANVVHIGLLYLLYKDWLDFGFLGFFPKLMGVTDSVQLQTRKHNQGMIQYPVLC